jgi:NADPH2:quinone reductase
MKALRSHAVGGPETLVIDDIAQPVPAQGEVLIAVRACGINFPDTLIIRDLYQYKPPRPFAPGAEVAGIICALGTGVTGFRIGDRVAAILVFGGLCEMVAVPADRVFALPDTVDFTHGAAMMLTFATSLHALKDRAQLQSGETLLVLGAAGGTGLSAVSLGKAMGARVVAAVSGADKAQAALATGADETVIYGAPPFDREASRALVAAFKSACGPGGANVIYDPVGGDFAEPAIRAIGWQGRYLVIGFTAGIASLPLNLALIKSADVRGVFYGEFMEREPARNRALMAELFALVAAEKAAPHICATLPLERAGEAIAMLADRRAIGKVVVTLGS